MACLRSHVLRAYCNFDSKQVISKTLLGRRPNMKKLLRVCDTWRLPSSEMDELSPWHQRCFVMVDSVYRLNTI